MPPEAIVVTAASKRYGDHPALRGVSFRVKAGEAVGYLGPNGAGKSTTLRLLCGLARPNEGEVRVLGLDPIRDHDEALRKVGVLVETPGILPYVTGADLLGYVAAAKGVAYSERPAEVRRAAELMGVAAHISRPMGGLSTGLTRRVLLAAGLIGDPAVLLLDEPTLGLDPAARQDLRRTLRGLREKGLTILLSTHLLEDVEEVCDRVLFLRDGLLVGDEPVGRDPIDEHGQLLRVLRLRFAGPVTEPELRAILPLAHDIEVTGRSEAIVRFVGGEERQAEVVAALVRRGLPLVGAAEPTAELARRYMDLVGREEDS